MTEAPRLLLSGIRKVYPAVVANENIDLRVKKGEIHAVLGENGAGKSTLMKIIYGIVPPTSGEIFWEGQRVQIKSPAQSRNLGIGMVFQHFSLFDTLSICDNVQLGLDHPPERKVLRAEIIAISNRYGLPVDPMRKVHSLSVGERQRVEIIRCLLQKPKLLIMDEPTSVLTPQAVRKLFATLRTLAAEGCSILYISHKLDEIKELCDFATIIRAGKVTGTCIPRDETPKTMARMMIGRDLPHYQHAVPAQNTKIVLEINNLSLPTDDPFGTNLKAFHLKVHAGEIVGLAGISGNGQKELLFALSGEEPILRKDSILIDGQPSGHLSPRQRRKLGFYFVPEERLGRGAVPDLDLSDNALLTLDFKGIVKRGFVNFKKVRSHTQETIEKFNVKCDGPDAEAQSLSGGNLQKFIVGRDMMQTPKVLVISQPTWGVDVGAAAFIRQSLIDLRGKNTAILVISEELDELFEISDRIAVIARGKLSPIKETSQTNVEEIGLWMSGLWEGNQEVLAAETTDV